MAEGLTNTGIGRRLVISPKTVEHHLSAVLDKLGLASRVDAAAAASRLRRRAQDEGGSGTT